MESPLEYWINVWACGDVLEPSPILGSEIIAAQNILEQDGSPWYYIHTIHVMPNGEASVIDLGEDARAYAARQRADQKAEDAERRAIRDRQL